MSNKQLNESTGQYANSCKKPYRSFEPLLQKSKQPILCPNIHPGVYPYYNKESNSGLLRIAFEEKFRKINGSNTTSYPKIYSDRELIENIMGDREQHLHYQKDVRKKIEEKIRAYQASVEKRREKLNNLYLIEEREYDREITETANRKEREKIEEMRKTVEMVRAKREEERKQIVHEKRIQQYINRCEELKPRIVKKHLIESKHAQLQQIRENEAKRQMEKDLDRMWFELSDKENKAKLEREKRELMARKILELNLQETLNDQIREKQLFKAEQRRMTIEEKLDFDRLQEKLQKEQQEKLLQKRRDQEILLNELREQIRSQEEYLQKKKEEDEELAKVQHHYNLLELEKEKIERMDKVEQTKKECDMYREFSKELQIERRQEEKKLDELLEIYTKEVQKKYDEAQCKLIGARAALEEDCIVNLAQQMEIKRQEAENRLRAKQAENELLELSYKANKRLQIESDLVAVEAAKQYREDLRQQIEYKNRMRERERQELERQIQKGKEEEEKYEKLVLEIIQTNNGSPIHKHPFRRVLEKYDSVESTS